MPSSPFFHAPFIAKVLVIVVKRSNSLKSIKENEQKNRVVLILKNRRIASQESSSFAQILKLLFFMFINMFLSYLKIWTINKTMLYHIEKNFSTNKKTTIWVLKEGDVNYLINWIFVWNWHRGHSRKVTGKEGGIWWKSNKMWQKKDGEQPKTWSHSPKVRPLKKSNACHYRFASIAC